MNNKNLFASILTVTSGLAAPMTFPQYALAKSTFSEPQHAEYFKLKLNAPARYTDNEGVVHEGFIYLNLDQNQFSPTYNNKLKAEMSGALYFVSAEYNQGLISQDENEVILDLINDGSYNGYHSRTYQVYGCNSSRTSCQGETYQVSFFDDKTVKLQFNIRAEHRIEVLVQHGTSGEQSWERSGRLEMIQVPFRQ